MRSCITRGIIVLSACWSALAVPLYSSTGQLETSDVPSVMENILRYHVEESEMTPALIRRTLNVYVEQFDPEKSYLLEQEIKPFIDPSPDVLLEVLAQYREGDLSFFEDLNEVLGKSIERSRAWRVAYTQKTTDLFAAAQGELQKVDFHALHYADSPAELKKRLRGNLVRFIQFQKKQLGAELVDERPTDVLRLFERTRAAHENRYLFYDEVAGPITGAEREHRFTLLVLKAMAKSLDSHTAFFSEAEAYDMKVRLEKGFHGVGIVLQEGLDGVSVTRLIEGGPADKDGEIKVKDRIVSVDGVSIVDFSFHKVLEVIRGQLGSEVVLGIRRSEDVNGKSVESEIEVVLTRENIVINSNRVDTSFERVDGGIIGTVTLHSFYEGAGGISSVRDVRNAIRDLRKEGEIKGLVLDLRQNTGGFLLQAVKVAGLFIPSGVVVVSKYSTGEKRYFRDIDGHAYYDGPLVVLTSRVSASAAEIVAQALQDYGVGIVVGDDRTYGKGSIQHQTVTDGSSTSFFKVTVGRYYTVSGRSTQIRGVEADIVVPTVFHSEELGEKFLDYPLPPDTIPAAFADPLEDLDPEARRWYERHYVPSLAERNDEWQEALPILRQRSLARLQKDTGYKRFLKESEEGTMMRTMDSAGKKQDHPMSEAKLILKDMILYREGTLNATSTSQIEKSPKIIKALH